jgi:hypothetical protein
MSAEIAIIAGTSIAGALSAAFLEKLSRSKGDKRQPQPSGAARVELLSVLFEKNLAAEAITRVYEASQEGRIDRLERDRLLLKYKQQLDSLNQKVTALQPAADYSDISELRDNLVSLLENKISALDKRLQEIKSTSRYDAVDAKVQKIIAETSKVQPTPVVQKPFKAEEKSVDQLQNEIIQALERLEQVEIDKD